MDWSPELNCEFFYACALKDMVQFAVLILNLEDEGAVHISTRARVVRSMLYTVEQLFNHLVRVDIAAFHQPTT